MLYYKCKIISNNFAVKNNLEIIYIKHTPLCVCIVKYLHWEM